MLNENGLLHPSTLNAVNFFRVILTLYSPILQQTTQFNEVVLYYPMGDKMVLFSLAVVVSLQP